MSIEATIYCLKCGWESKGLVPIEVGQTEVLTGEVATKIQEHHIDSGIEGKCLRHRDFIALIENGRIGSVVGSSYTVLYKGYGKSNINEIDYDQTLNGPEIKDFISMVKTRL